MVHGVERWNDFEPKRQSTLKEMFGDAEVVALDEDRKRRLQFVLALREAEGDSSHVQLLEEDLVNAYVPMFRVYHALPQLSEAIDDIAEAASSVPEQAVMYRAIDERAKEIVHNTLLTFNGAADLVMLKKEIEAFRFKDPKLRQELLAEILKREGAVFT